MSFKIKIPKISESREYTTTASGRRATKRRIAATYSDDDDEDEQEDPDSSYDVPTSSKRARTQSRHPDDADANSMDVDIDGEKEVDVDVDVESATDDTRFLPSTSAAKSATRNRSSGPSKEPQSRSGAKGSGSTKKTSLAKKKRAVVLSDESEEEYGEKPDLDEDRDFTPEPASKKAGPSAKSRGKSLLAKSGKGKAGKDKEREDREITMKDERKIPPAISKDRAGAAMQRSRPRDDDVSVEDAGKAIDDAADKDKEPTPPLPVKKRKLPPIKKNKPATAGSTAPSTPGTKPPVKGGAEAEGSSALPVPPARKPVGATGNTDFDLRDKSVYASLFTKPGGTTPNSGLNRKEKEEERRKELNKMRDEARAKRAEEAKHTFDLQAAQEKIQRFEEKLHSRKSMVVYPNILGAAFKESFERARRRERERK